MRAMATFFALLALPTYAKLWDGYQNPGERIGARATLLVTALPFGAVCAYMHINTETTRVRTGHLHTRSVA